ncbi:MAG: peptidoglycan-binding protein [Gemmatimonadetes bacterium]|nr:peptidoglycan-binding protein [Gemmatimonadota bacterium]
MSWCLPRVCLAQLNPYVMMRSPSFRSYLAVLLLTPAALIAQQPDSTRVHVVKRGDTLWDIAASYLKDPFKWPDIYRINRDVVENPHWIYPGEKLRIPGAGEMPMPVAAAPDATAPNSSRGYHSGPTVFSPAAPYTRGISITADSEQRAVRSGEFLSAPYVSRVGGPKGSGRIIKSADIPAIDEQTQRYRLHEYDAIFVQPPTGSVAAEGERYLAVRMGVEIDGVGQVVQPTAVIEVTRAPHAGESATARVVRIFNELRADDMLIPYDTAGMGARGRPQRITTGRWATVKWIAQEPVLPSIQNFAVLNLGTREGVRPGDEFLIFKPRKLAEKGELADPEIAVARAQAVRVTPFATTVIITSQQQAKIQEGQLARVTARMP